MIPLWHSLVNIGVSSRFFVMNDDLLADVGFIENVNVFLSQFFHSNSHQ
jgi:hypothetical protein